MQKESSTGGVCSSLSRGPGAIPVVKPELLVSSRPGDPVSPSRRSAPQGVVRSCRQQLGSHVVVTSSAETTGCRAGFSRALELHWACEFLLSPQSSFSLFLSM